MLNLGFKAGPEQGPFDLLDGAIAADQAGFDFMDVNPGPSSGIGAGKYPFNWTWLGAAAVKTRKISIGTAVSCRMLRDETAIIAQAAQTLAVIARGRSYVSISLDECAREVNDEDGWVDTSEQQDMTAEAITLLRKLWSGQPVTHNGNYFHLRQAELHTNCDQTVPIHISVQAPGTAYFAGYYGDGLITSGGMQPYVYRRILGEFSRGARDAGKDPARLTRTVELPVTYANDAETEQEPFYQPWETSFFDSRRLIPVTAKRQTVAEPRKEQALCSAADPDCHTELAQEYIDMGFNNLLFRPVMGTSLEFIKAYGSEILPRLRASNPGDF
jgi:coenzyme F420-dependent glucose-6-phosphate dehydrogenase